MPIEKFSAAVPPQDTIPSNHLSQKIIDTQAGRLFGWPVNFEDAVEFRDMARGDHLKVLIDDNQTQSVFIKVAPGVKVSVADPAFTRIPVHVTDFAGKHSIAQGYVYNATDKKENINCKYQWEQPAAGRLSQVRHGDETFELATDLRGQEERITCRHFVMQALLAREDKSISWKDFRAEFFHKDGLANLFTSQAVLEDLDLDVNYGDRYLVPLNFVGRGLRDLFSKMRDDNAKELLLSGSIEMRSMLVLSYWNNPEATEHACALIMRIKHGEDGQLTYKFKLYDPNRTQNHVAYSTNNLADMSTLTRQDLLLQVPEYANFDLIEVTPLPTEWFEGQTFFSKIESSGVNQKMYVLDTDEDAQGFMVQREVPYSEVVEHLREVKA